MKPKPSCSIAARCRTARGAERVRQLQQTAADMFLSCGYEGVSVDGLIHRVGGSRRNVWSVYGGKPGLFEAAVNGLCEEISVELALLPMDGADMREGLLLYGRCLLKMVLQPRMLAMHRLMVSEGGRFPEQARSMSNTGRENAAVSLGRWLSGHQERGLLRAGLDTVELAHQFFHLVAGAPQLRALIGELPPGWTDEGIASHVSSAVDLFLHGAATPQDPQPAQREQRP